jgi:hypothetical protein
VWVSTHLRSPFACAQEAFFASEASGTSACGLQVFLSHIVECETCTSSTHEALVCLPVLLAAFCRQILHQQHRKEQRIHAEHQHGPTKVCQPQGCHLIELCRGREAVRKAGRKEGREGVLVEGQSQVFSDSMKFLRDHDISTQTRIPLYTIDHHVADTHGFIPHVLSRPIAKRNNCRAKDFGTRNQRYLMSLTPHQNHAPKLVFPFSQSTITWQTPTGLYIISSQGQLKSEIIVGQRTSAYQNRRVKTRMHQPIPTSPLSDMRRCVTEKIGYLPWLQKPVCWGLQSGMEDTEEPTVPLLIWYLPWLFHLNAGAFWQAWKTQIQDLLWRPICQFTTDCLCGGLGG